MKIMIRLVILLIPILLLSGCFNNHSKKTSNVTSDTNVAMSEEIILLDSALVHFREPFEIQREGNETTIIYSERYSSTRYVFVNDTLNYIIQDDCFSFDYDEVEVKPSFQEDSTLTAFHNWVDNNIYWPEDQPDAIGWVVVDFDIMPDGVISNVIITKGICDSIDRVTREVLMKSPKWTPGTINNKPCFTRITDFRVKWVLK